MFESTSELEKWHRADWMTDDQWQCWLLVSELRGGFHHVDGKPRPFGQGIEVNTSLGCWASFDYDDLTRALFLAHDHAIRIEIRPSGPRMLKLCLWYRGTREGGMCERHPTIEQAISKWRRQKDRKRAKKTAERIGQKVDDE
mgnify:CR=1 FL=1